MRAKAQSGTMPGRAPVGYRNVERGGFKSIEPDPATHWQVAALFALVNDGLSIRKADLHACGLGLRSRNGKVMSVSALHAILTNPFYRGCLRYKGELLPGRHKPLVSAELFEMVQQKLRHTGRLLDSDSASLQKSGVRQEQSCP